MRFLNLYEVTENPLLLFSTIPYALRAMEYDIFKTFLLFPGISPE